MKRKFFTLLTLALAMGGSASAQCPNESQTAVESVNSGDFYYLRYTTANAADVNEDNYFAVTKGDSVVSLTESTYAAKGDSAIWQIIKLDDKYYQFKNKATGNVMSLNANGAAAAKFGWNFGSTTTVGAPQKLGFISNFKNYQVQVGTVVDSVYMEETASAGVNVYPTKPGWVKLTATQLNEYYSDFFQLFDNSATSQTDQAQASHAAIQSKFYAEPSTIADAYRLNVLNTNKYLNVDTVYYNRIGLIDSTAKLGGHILVLDTLATDKSDSSYIFTIWKSLVSDSLAIQTYGIPVISESGADFDDEASMNASYTDNGWITLSSYDAGFKSTALTAAEGCFNKNMPNPSFSLTKGQGKQVEAGYYYIYKGLVQDSMYVAKLANYMEDEEFALIPVNEGKAWVAAAQWYVPTTSYYPQIFNRESSMQAMTRGIEKFYEVLDSEGNVVPNSFEVIGAAGIDTITMISIPSEITDNIYLGYKNFAPSKEALDVTSAIFQFNTTLNPSVAFVTTPDSLLSVSTTIDESDAIVYKMIPVDTFSIGADTLRAISYKFYTVNSKKDTLWLATQGLVLDEDLSDRWMTPDWTAGTRMYNSTLEENAGVFLIRATYNENLYQIFQVISYSSTEVLPSAVRQSMILERNIDSEFYRDLVYQVSVASSTAQIYSNENVLDFDGLWSFVNPMAPEYATIATPQNVMFESSENAGLFIGMGAAKNGTLKSTKDELKANYTEDNFKFYLQAANNDVVKPLYTISTQYPDGKAALKDTMYYMNTVLNTGSNLVAPQYNVNPTDSIGFNKAVLANDTLYFAKTKDAVAKLPAYTYAFRKTAVDGQYYIESQASVDLPCLAQVNGVLTTAKTANLSDALPFILNENVSSPTGNEDVTVSEVTVIAGQGNVTIAGAAGKKVTISNILGQVVATTVLSSDNATIAAPQGVVVVAVEGEAAVKAIVK